MMPIIASLYFGGILVSEKSAMVSPPVGTLFHSNEFKEEVEKFI